MKIRLIGERSLKFRCGFIGQLIYAQRNTRMWDSVACHGCSRGGDRVGLEAANLIGVYLNEIAIHAETNPTCLDISAAL